MVGVAVEGECLGRAGLAHARLINANSLVHKGIVDHDRLGGDFLAVFDQRQLGPPFFRTAVGVGLFSGTIAADQEWKCLLALAAVVIAHDDLAERLSLRDIDVAAITDDAVHDVSGKDAEQAQVDQVDGEDGIALLLGK